MGSANLGGLGCCIPKVVIVTVSQASGCQNNTNCKDAVVCAGGWPLTDTTNFITFDGIRLTPPQHPHRQSTTITTIIAIMAPHYLTPVKAHLIGTVAFLDHHHIQYFHTDLFKDFGIRSKTQGWEILRIDKDRRHPEHETRGRKRIISLEDLHRMEEVI